MNINCEEDCKYICTGCDKSFCEIKENENIPHNEYIKDAYINDDKYCSDHCYPYQ